MFVNRLIQSKWSAIAPLLSALVLMSILWTIHYRFAEYPRKGVDRPPVTLTVEKYSGQLDFMSAMEVQVTAIIVAVVVGVGLAISSIRKCSRSEMLVVCTILILGAAALTIL